MALIDEFKELASKIPKVKEELHTEEATKLALVQPFISKLGYDVSNPSEVIPEFTADAGIKKGEKVDYAIKKDGKIIILVECKKAEDDLNKDHYSQLYRYFSSTKVKFAILTNGIEYEFFSDIENKNIMDKKPFFVFNLLHFEDHQINELNKFTKNEFSLDEIHHTAENLKYTGAIKNRLREELDNPSEEFVRFFTKSIYSGNFTEDISKKFTIIVKDARAQFINECAIERIKSAMPTNKQETITTPIVEDDSAVASHSEKNTVVTTSEEKDGYSIVKAILREVVKVKRVTMRDTKGGYCGVLLDDNNRKPICRLYFDSTQKYLGVFTDKNEERIKIDSIDGIFKHADRLKATVAEYEKA